MSALRTVMTVQGVVLLIYGHPMLLVPRRTSRAELVNDFETPGSRIYCRASSVAAAAGGGLIQTATGSAGGWGGLRTKRSGCAA